MKHAKIKNIIEKRLQAIAQYHIEVKDDFTIEQIHSFRLEVKKLRAFLSLINLGQPDKLPFIIPSQIKSFYDIIGEIRNTQLHQQRIIEVCTNESLKTPEKYFEYLEARQALLKEQALFVPFDREQIHQILLPHLPAKTNKKTLLEFNTEKNARIQELASLPLDPDILHEIRKNCKEILYNLKYTQKDGNAKEGNLFFNKKTIRPLTDELGNHHDLYTSLYMIWYYTICVNDNNENDILKPIQQSFHHDEQALKSAIDHQLHETFSGNVPIGEESDASF